MIINQHAAADPTQYDPVLLPYQAEDKFLSALNADLFCPIFRIVSKVMEPFFFFSYPVDCFVALTTWLSQTWPDNFIFEVTSYTHVRKKSITYLLKL